MVGHALSTVAHGAEPSEAAVGNSNERQSRRATNVKGQSTRLLRARQTRTDKECSEERLREAMFVKLEWAL